MAARDRFTEAVTCPKCKQAGVLHISEDDYPFSPPHRSVDEIKGNFTAAVLHGVRMRLTCGACGEQWET
jgi:ssDNA-binding Zn-finger/Zn-ribbon topoisomerase 1